MISLNPDQLLQEHADALYQYSLPRVRNAEIAEDLILQTLRAALMQQAPSRLSVRDWLLQILRGKILDSFRPALQQAVIPSLEPETAFRKSGEWIDHWTDDGGPVEWNLSDPAEFRRMLSRCIEELPTPLFQVLVLREMENMRPLEIAALYRMQPRDVERILHLAREQLRFQLESRYFRGSPFEVNGFTAELKRA